MVFTHAAREGTSAGFVRADFSISESASLSGFPGVLSSVSAVGGIIAEVRGNGKERSSKNI
jgi:hypothetical protein